MIHVISCGVDFPKIFLFIEPPCFFFMGNSLSIIFHHTCFVRSGSHIYLVTDHSTISSLKRCLYDCHVRANVAALTLPQIPLDSHKVSSPRI